MFELFVALFGGAYAIAKCAGYHNRDVECSREVKKVLEIDEMLTRLDKDKSFFNNINESEMLNEIEDDLEYIYGTKEWRSYYDAHACFTQRMRDYRPCPSWIGDIWTVAYEVFLSTKGQIPWERKYGYNACSIVDGVKGVSYEIPAPEEIRQEHSKIIKRFFRVLEKNLQKHHPDLNMRLWAGYQCDFIFEWEYCFFGVRPRTSRPW